MPFYLTVQSNAMVCRLESLPPSLSESNRWTSAGRVAQSLLAAILSVAAVERGYYQTHLPSHLGLFKNKTLKNKFFEKIEGHLCWYFYLILSHFLLFVLIFCFFGFSFGFSRFYSESKLFLTSVESLQRYTKKMSTFPSIF